METDPFDLGDPQDALGERRDYNEAFSKRVAQEVILQAFEDLQEEPKLLDGVHPITVRRSAIQFLTQPSDLLTFWCELAGHDPKLVIEGAKRKLKVLGWTEESNNYIGQGVRAMRRSAQESA